MTSTPLVTRTMICCPGSGWSFFFWISLPVTAPPSVPSTIATSRPVPRADQAADAEARQSADDRADAAMMVGRHLHFGDLLDDAAADFPLSGLRHRGGPDRQSKRQHGRRHERKHASFHRDLLVAIESDAGRAHDPPTRRRHCRIIAASAAMRATRAAAARGSPPRSRCRSRAFARAGRQPQPRTGRPSSAAAPTRNCRSGSRRTCGRFPAPTRGSSSADSCSSTGSRRARSRRAPSKTRSSCRPLPSALRIPTSGSPCASRRSTGCRTRRRRSARSRTRAQVNLFSARSRRQTTLSLQQLYVRRRRRVRRRQDVLDVRRRRRAADDARLQRAERRDVRRSSGSRAARFRSGGGWTIAGGIEDAQADGSAGAARVDVRTQRAPAGPRRAPALRLRARPRAGCRTFAAHRGDRDERALAHVRAHGRRQRHLDLRFARDRSATIRSSGSTRRARASGATSTMRVSSTGVALGADGRLGARPQLRRATLYYQRRWAADWMSVAGVSTLVGERWRRARARTSFAAWSTRRRT